MSLLFLGVDPALCRTGYALVGVKKRIPYLVDKGLITTDSRKHLSQRLLKIHTSINNVIKKYNPRGIVLEKIYSHPRHPLTSTILGEVRGIILLLASQNKINIYEYPITHIKKALTGRGSASKYQIKRMVEFFMKEEIGPQDIIDAIALVLTHLHSLRE